MNTSYEALEAKRKRIMYVTIVLAVIAMLLYMAATFWIMQTFDIPRRSIRLLAVPFVYLIYKYYNDQRRDYIAEFNASITSVIIDRLRPEWQYTPDAGVDHDVIFDSHLIEPQKYNYTSNLATGEIRGVDFEFCHVETVKTQKIQGRIPKVEFKGYYFVFDFPKLSTVDIHVHPPILKDFGEVLKIPEKVKSDASEFNKVYNTYCDDPIKMRHILTLGLMERMINFQDDYPNAVSFLFEADKVKIAIKTKASTIEPSIFKSLSLEAIESVHARTFDHVENIIEQLKLQADAPHTEELS